MKTIIRKIKEFLFVRREETMGRWWHRLALVFIYGGAISVTIFLTGLAIDEVSGLEKYKSYSYTYSFEQGYEYIEGEEIVCTLNLEKYNLPTIPFSSVLKRCGNTEEVVKKYNDFIRSVLLTDDIKGQCANVSQVENTPGRYVPISERDYVASECKELLSSTEAIKPGLNLTALGISESLFSTEQKNFLRDSYEKLKNLTAKRHLEGTRYGEIIIAVLQSILVIVLGLVAWIVIFESIIYRTILYIIYGKVEIKQ